MTHSWTARPILYALLLAATLGACARTDATVAGQPSLDTARVALANGSAGLALTICNGLLAQRPNGANLLVCRGDALTAMGRNAEAITAYEAALRSDPKWADAKIGLGRIALATDPARAEALFVDALTSNPRNAIALNNLGIARDLQGRHADAQVSYGEAIAAAPDLRAPQVNLALSLALTGRAEEAVRIMRPIGSRENATPRERHDLAAVLTIDGHPDEAAALLRRDLDGPQVDQAISGFQALPTRQ